MEIKKPEMFELAEEGGKYTLVVQILMFIVVFLIASFVGSIPQIIILLSDFATMVQEIVRGTITLENIDVLINKMLETRPFLYATLFGTLLSSIVVILWSRFVEKRSLKSIGFKRKNAFRSYLIGLLIGFIMFSLVVGINLLSGAMTIEAVTENLNITTLGFILVFFIGFIFQGAFEEILVRGYFMVNIGAKYKVITALLVSSIIFAILHGANTGITFLSLINLILIAVFWGLHVICFDNIWGACAMHSIWNFAQGNFYGINVSGLNITDSIFIATSVPGKELINGGAFGAEGGTATTSVILLAIAILLLYMKKKGKFLNNTKKTIAN